MRIHEPLIAFSAYQGTDLNLNRARHRVLKDRLAGLGIEFIPLQGAYQGIPEESVLVHASHETVVRALTQEYLQHTYLFLHPDRHAELRSPWTGETTPLGTLREVPEAVALTQDAYSITPDGRYWSTKS